MPLKSYKRPPAIFMRVDFVCADTFMAACRDQLPPSVLHQVYQIKQQQRRWQNDCNLIREIELRTRQHIEAQRQLSQQQSLNVKEEAQLVQRQIWAVDDALDNPKLISLFSEGYGHLVFDKAESETEDVDETHHCVTRITGSTERLIFDMIGPRYRWICVGPGSWDHN